MYLKDRLAAGEPLIGAGIYSGSPDMLEYAARGMDWVWWECQHSHDNWQTILHGVRTAYGMRVPALVRSWTDDGATLERLLDTGAEGIIVPMVDTPEQAEQIVSRCYYPPLGNRSYGAIRMVSVEDDVAEWNKRIVTVMMVETPRAVENAAAIAAVSGVDALLLGSSDLTLRLGNAPRTHTSHGECQEEMARVVEACRAAGKAAATITSSVEALEARLDEGFRLICAGMDLDHVKAGYQQMQAAFARITGDGE
jgi:4-hydroxy-2-oxoheptanedioate aldolase